MTTIPASTVVSVIPGVLAAGGSELELLGLLLTDSTRVPIGSVQAFPSATAVGAYFGANSVEKGLADHYFAGFDDSDVKPGSILFSQYNKASVAAFLRGGDISDLTLAQLQALNGAIAVTINGVLASSTLSLSTATSFSNAGQLIAAALSLAGAQAASVTGSIAGTTLTVTAIGSGALGVGDVLSGTAVTANTFIVQQLTGVTGSVGTYQVSASQARSSQVITAFAPAVTYDSVTGAFVFTSGTAGSSSTITFASGALGTSLKLTEATGAVISQGAAGVTPAQLMDGITQVTQNFATFMTTFNPDVSGNTLKQAFATWNSLQNDRYTYVCWDADASPTTTVPATSSLGYLLAQSSDSGTALIYAPDGAIAAFICGYVASIDFNATEGRATAKFRKQAGLAASVSDETIAANLAANGYNFYGAYGTANDSFIFFANGVITGDFEWLDSYINQIQLNNSLQLALMTFLTTAKSVPYNTAGYTAIEAACADPINSALNFGSIRAGVTLSESQIVSVNTQAGRRISDVLSQRGWYLQVLDASAVVRAARGSPPCKFWYMDGESVQQIELSSIAVL